MGLPILLYIFLASLRLFILIIQSDCEINMRERLKHEKKKKCLPPSSTPYLEKTDTEFLRNVLAIFRRNLSRGAG